MRPVHANAETVYRALALRPASNASLRVSLVASSLFQRLHRAKSISGRSERSLEEERAVYAGGIICPMRFLDTRDAINTADCTYYCFARVSTRDTRYSFIQSVAIDRRTIGRFDRKR